jgi:hypothetical protein
MRRRELTGDRITVSRRSLLQFGIALPVLLTASACVPSDGTHPTATATPTPTATRKASAAPATEASYGPNGTHYPESLQWIGGVAENEIEVACSWAAITSAIRALRPSQWAAGVIVRVRPGVLVGGGAGSSKPPVLSNLGALDGTGQVLICPRDGYGTVRVEQQGVRIDNCHGLAIFGIDGPDVEMYVTSCSRISIGWGIWSGMSLTRSGRDIALYEVVLGFRRSETDTFAVRPTDGGPMTDLTRYGCVFGPSVKAAGSGAHCDTIQLERTGSGDFGPFTSVDCTDFGSSNAVIQAHDRLSLLEYRHSLILGGQLPWTVYPLQAGDYAGDPNAFSGNCLDVRLNGSVVNGAVGRTGFTSVVGSSIGYGVQASQEPTVEGSWAIDPGIAAWNGDQVRSVAGTDFSRPALSSKWKW